MDEDADYETRVSNSKARAKVVADELRKLVAWMEKHTGGTARVDDVGLIDDLLDRYQRDDPNADITDAIREIAIVEILHLCQKPDDVLENAALKYRFERNG